MATFASRSASHPSDRPSVADVMSFANRRARKRRGGGSMLTLVPRRPHSRSRPRPRRNRRSLDRGRTQSWRPSIAPADVTHDARGAVVMGRGRSTFIPISAGANVNTGRLLLPGMAARAPSLDPTIPRFRPPVGRPVRPGATTRRWASTTVGRAGDRAAITRCTPISNSPTLPSSTRRILLCFSAATTICCD